MNRIDRIRIQAIADFRLAIADWDSFQAPFAVGDVVQKTRVAEDLELLADFNHE